MEGRQLRCVEERLLTAGGASLYVRGWMPESPWATLQIAHGMAEHMLRYDTLAQVMAEQGIAVYGNDHAGHGRSAEPGRYGYFYARNGWQRVVEDVHEVHGWIAARHPGVPCVLLGHSMGSFLARSYMVRYGTGLQGVVLSGTAGPNPALPLGKALAAIEMRRLKPYEPSRLIDRIAFSANNKAFAPARTKMDWLSRDPAVVDAYMADPACGFVFTATGYRDLFEGLTEIQARGWADGVPKQLPVLLVSGQRDPVGGMGKGVRWVESALKQAGVKDVACILYPEARHEPLNEWNREDLYKDILTWMRRVLSAAAQIP